MAVTDRIRRRQAEAVAPYLEEGEEVRASVLGQTPVPTLFFVLIGPLMLVFIQKYRLIVATDRNIYVMENSFLRSYKFKGVAYKTPLRSARVESGNSWVSIDGGPKLHGALWGPLKTQMKELVAYLEAAAPPPPLGETSAPTLPENAEDPATASDATGS